MMRFDDFDIDIVAEYARRGVEQFQAQIHADAHVRGEYDTDTTGRITNLLFLLRFETGGADDDVLTVTHAQRQVSQGCFGTGEIDQCVDGPDHIFQTVDQAYVEAAESGQITGITAEQRAA